MGDIMRYGLRKPSYKKSLSNRLSVKRRVRSRVRLPKGARLFTNPKRYWYDKLYHKTTISLFGLLKKIF